MKHLATAIEEAIHFIKTQDEKSSHDGKCRYYSNGLRCAIGGLLSPELAAKLEEVADGMCWPSLTEKYLNSELGFEADLVVEAAMEELRDYDPAILILIQAAHDAVPVGPDFGARFEQELRHRYEMRAIYG